MPVNTPSLPYAKACDPWKRCRDCYGGEDAVKAEATRYLLPLEGQKLDGSDHAYKAYLRRAMFYPAGQRTVLGLIGMVLRKDIQVSAPPDVEKHLANLTLTGEGLTEIALRLLEDDLVVGRIGILLDWSPGAARPFWKLYCAEQIVNYAETVVDGVPVVTRIVLREDVEDPDPADPYTCRTVTQYRELFLSYVETAGQEPYFAAFVQVHRKDPTQDRWLVVEGPNRLDRRGRPLPWLPFTFLGPVGVQPAIDKPPLLDLFNLNLSHYRTSADLEHGRHWTALPTPWITGWTSGESKMAIGSGEAWMIPPADAKVGMLEFTGQGLGALEKAIEQKEKSMAIIGARLLEGTPLQQETAEAVRMRHSGEHAVLATIVRAASEAVSDALQKHAWWMGHEDVRGEVSDANKVFAQLNTDFFDNRITAQEATALMQLWQGGGISYETFYWNLQQGEWARPEVTWEDERKQIDAEEPPMEPTVVPAAGGASASRVPGAQTERSGGAIRGSERGDDGSGRGGDGYVQ